MRTPSKATLKKYGLSLDEWIALYNKHDGRCWICKAPFDGSDRRYEPRTACVDHEHVKGFKKMSDDEKRQYIRGMLCFQCNRLIAQKSNTVEKLQAGISYLNNYKRRSASVTRMYSKDA